MILPVLTLPFMMANATGQHPSWRSPFDGEGRWVTMALRVEPYKGEILPMVKLYRKLGFDAVAVDESFESMVSSLHNPPAFVILPSVAFATKDGEIRGVGVMRPLPSDLENAEEVLKVIGVWQGFALWTPSADAPIGELPFASGLNGIEGNGDWIQIWSKKVVAREGPWVVCADPKSSEKLQVPGQAWVEVWVLANEQRYLLQALHKGAFYATTGPKIRSFRFSDRDVWLDLEEECCVTLLGPDGGQLAQANGRDVRVKIDKPVSSFRAEVTGADGTHAWTQPVWMN